MSIYLYKMPLWIVIAIFIYTGALWYYLSQRFCNNEHGNTKWRCFNIILCFLSVVFILYITLINRSNEIRTINLIPFDLLINAFQYSELFRSLLLNIFLFTPLGLTLTQALPSTTSKKKRYLVVFISSFILSSMIEVLQYTFSLGQTEIDDVICNIFGALLGGLVIYGEKIYAAYKRCRISDTNVVGYVFATFTFSWFFWGILSIITSWELISFSSRIGTMLYILGGFGPIFGTLFINNGKQISIDLRLIFRCKSKGVFTFSEFCAATTAIFAISSIELSSSFRLYSVPIVFILSVLINGGNQEVGWRGVLQTKLESKFGFAVSSFLTGITWSIWYIPLWFVIGTPHSKFSYFIFTVLCVVFSFYLGAIYKKTENTLYCSFFRGLIATLLSVFVFKLNIVFLIGLCALLFYTFKTIKEKTPN